MKGFRGFFRLKNVAVLAAAGGAAVASGFVVAHCATSLSPIHKSWDPRLPGNIPDLGFKSWDNNWDLRDPRFIRRSMDEDGEPKKIQKPSAIRHLILVRHGQYNLKGKSDEERYLTELGEEQAKLAGKRLKQLDIPWTSLTSSNMTRAMQTAEFIKNEIKQEGLEIQNKDPLLREGAPALPEPPVSHWHPDLSYYEDGARIEAGFRKYFHRADPSQKEDSYELIVCHANVIRYFACRALQFPGEAWLRISLAHTSFTVVSILPSGRIIVRTIGDGGHLPGDKVTTS